MDYLVIYYNNNLEFHIHKFIHSIDDDEVVRLATYIDETDFLIEENPTADVVGDYIIYFSNKEMTLKEIKIDLEWLFKKWILKLKKNYY